MRKRDRAKFDFCFGYLSAIQNCVFSSFRKLEICWECLCLCVKTLSVCVCLYVMCIWRAFTCTFVYHCSRKWFSKLTLFCRCLPFIMECSFQLTYVFKCAVHDVVKKHFTRRFSYAVIYCWRRNQRKDSKIYRNLRVQKKGTEKTKGNKNVKNHLIRKLFSYRFPLHFSERFLCLQTFQHGKWDPFFNFCAVFWLHCTFSSHDIWWIRKRIFSLFVADSEFENFHLSMFRIIINTFLFIQYHIVMFPEEFKRWCESTTFCICAILQLKKFNETWRLQVEVNFCAEAKAGNGEKIRSNWLRGIWIKSRKYSKENWINESASPRISIYEK